ncbi:MAG: hypothetical protein KIT09_02175 [Bryobacteraceae bacterium]|nr:hypothetical protein [Bryobacteraceae bacterium]
MTSKPEFRFDEVDAATQAVVAIEAGIPFSHLDANGIQGVDHETWIKAHVAKTPTGELTVGSRLDLSGMARTCLAGPLAINENLAVALLAILHTEPEAAMEQVGAELARNRNMLEDYFSGILRVAAGVRRYGRLSYRAVRRRLLDGELEGLGHRLHRLRISPKSVIPASRRRKNTE